MKSMLIITTANDLSLPLFLTDDIKQKIGIDTCFFHEETFCIEKKMLSQNYDYIYFRDPFNCPYDEENIKEKFSVVMKNKEESYIVDNLKDLDDVYFEDKWKQYQLFPEFMPSTKILSRSDEINDSCIVKKRISSRAKGIIFDSRDLAGENLSDYIFQEKFIVDKEYRVYVIGGDIVQAASVKSSKTPNTKVKVLAVEKLALDVENFVKAIVQKIPQLDFVGLDIIRSDNNLYLLEVNRSCLFNAYFKITGVNLAEYFIDKLSTRNTD